MSGTVQHTADGPIEYGECWRCGQPIEAGPAEDGVCLDCEDFVCPECGEDYDDCVCAEVEP